LKNKKTKRKWETRKRTATRAKMGAACKK